MTSTRTILSIVACLASATIAQVAAVPAPTTSVARPALATRPAEPYVNEIRKFEAADATTLPAAGGIVFVGSSTFRIWDTAAALPELSIINRGFGGSHMEDVLQYADRIVTKYRPTLVVLYEGDNDLKFGKSPAVVMRQIRQFADLLARQTPRPRLALVSVKPSPARAMLMPQMNELNAMQKAFADENPQWAAYLDMVSLTLDAQGQPRPELYRADGLHLNAAGYVLWTDAMRPALEKLLRE